MSNSELIERLRTTALFGAANEATLDAVATAMRPTNFKAGQSIFSRSDQGRELYFVCSGRVKISVLTAEGRELALTHITDGGIFGEIAMLDGGPRTADATALTPTSVTMLTSAALDALLNETPDLARAMMTFLCARLRETDRQIEAIALHRIDIRLARYLVAICRQLQPEQETGEIVFDLAVSQGELALLLGASRPKVNGALVALEDQGIIARKGARLTCQIDDLLDIAELD